MATWIFVTSWCSICGIVFKIDQVTEAISIFQILKGCMFVGFALRIMAYILKCSE